MTALVLSLIHVTANAQQVPAITPRLGISPPRIEIELDDSGLANGEFTILNLSSRDMPLALSVVHWDLDDDSQVRTIPPTEQSLDQWLVINPLQFVIPASGSQTVRFGVRPRVRPEAGEHRAMVYISEQAADATDGGLNVRLNYGLPIYANASETLRLPIIHDVSLEPLPGAFAVTLDVENRGNAYVRPGGHIGVWSQDDYPGDFRAIQWLEADADGRAELLIEEPVVTGRLLSQPVLGGSRRQQVSRVPRGVAPGAGAQVVVVTGAIEGQPIRATFPIAD